MIVIPLTSPKVLNGFFEHKRDVVYRYMLRQIDKHIETDIKRIDLFTFADTGITTALMRDDFQRVATDALNYFIELEDYDSANYARKVLDKLSVHQFLKGMTPESN